jgi:multidrug efflux pump subunit AcrA (membrane-fusion protein)
MSTELSTQRAMGVPLHEERYNGEQQASVASPTLTRKATRNHWRALITVATLVVLCGNAGVWYVYSRHYATGDATAPDQHGVNSGKATLRYVSDVASNSDNSLRGTGETVSVEIIAIPSRLRVTGTLTADAQSSVASNVNGIVTEVRVDRGSVVTKQDVLVQLDVTDAQNRLTEGLAAQNAISVDECEQARSECECAVQRHRQSLQEARQDHLAYLTDVARLAALRKSVADTTIVAPFDGLVVEKHVTVGEQVAGGFTLSVSSCTQELYADRGLVRFPVERNGSRGHVARGDADAYHAHCPRHAATRRHALHHRQCGRHRGA